MSSAFVEVIRNRHFRWLWLAQITSQVALNILNFVLAIKVYQATQSNTAVSLLLLTFGIPSIFFGVVAGGIVDHLDKRKVLFFSNGLRTILLLFYFFAADNLPLLFILTIFVSIATQLFIPAEAPSIPRLVKPHQILVANSLFTISFYASTIGGFLAAGPAIRVFGENEVYLFITFLMALATYYVYRLPPLKPMSKDTMYSLALDVIGRTIQEGLSFIRHHKRVRQSLVLMTFAQAIIATLSVLAPGFADRILAIDLRDSSYIVMGPAALGLVLGALFVGSIGLRVLKRTIILAGILMCGLSLILLAILTNVAFPINSLFVAVLLLFLLGASNTFVSVPANTILQEDSSEEMRGRVYGVLTSLTGGISLLPVVLSGVLADLAGVGKAILTVGIVITGLGMYYYTQRKNLGGSVQ